MIKRINKENEKMLKEIGSMIKKLREKKKLSQEELAFQAKIDRTYISGIEKGERNISVTTYSKLAEALDVKINLAEILKHNV